MFSLATQDTSHRQETQSVTVDTEETNDESVEERHDDESVEDRHDESENETADSETRRSQRDRRPPVHFGLDEFADVTLNHTAYSVCHIKEPESMKEVLSSDQEDELVAAANSQFESLMENETWDLVDLPKGREAIGYLSKIC